MSAEFGPVVRRWLEESAANRDTPEFRVSLSAFRFITKGEAPAIERVANDLALSSDAVSSIIADLVDHGRLTVDASGEFITGAGGLSLIESRHELQMFDRRFWVWCALDAVGIPAGLGVDARISSSCSDTGSSVDITVAGGRIIAREPNGVVISLVAPCLDQSLRDNCCAVIGFYANPGAVPAGAEPISLPDAATLGEHLWRDGVPL